MYIYLKAYIYIHIHLYMHILLTQMHIVQGGDSSASNLDLLGHVWTEPRFEENGRGSSTGEGAGEGGRGLGGGKGVGRGGGEQSARQQHSASMAAAADAAAKADAVYFGKEKGAYIAHTTAENLVAAVDVRSGDVSLGKETCRRRALLHPISDYLAAAAEKAAVGHRAEGKHARARTQHAVWARAQESRHFRHVPLVPVPHPTHESALRTTTAGKNSQKIAHE